MSIMQSKYHKDKFNSCQSFFNFAEGAELPKVPLVMYLEISNLCDLRCAMCPQFSALNSDRLISIRSKKRGFIDLEQVKSIEPFLKSALQVHAFGYGEPMIHPDFVEILKLLGKYELLIDFFTNGMHLTEQACEEIVNAGVYSVTISFSGTTKEEYENVYINGKYNEVLDGIQRLNKCKNKANSKYPLIQINSIGFKHHVDKLPDFVRMMAKIGATHIHLKPLSLSRQLNFLSKFIAPYRVGIEGKKLLEAISVAKELGVALGVEVFTRTILPDDGDVDDYIRQRTISSDQADRAAQNIKENLQIENLKEFAKGIELNRPKSEDGGEEHDEISYPAELKLRYNSTEATCFEIFRSIYIHTNGNTRPCCFADQQCSTLGNAFMDNSCWTNSAFLQFREGVLDNVYPEMCSRCLRLKSAPRDHSIKLLIAQYSKWFFDKYGVPFHSSIQQGARKLADNETIRKIWETKA